MSCSLFHCFDPYMVFSLSATGMEFPMKWILGVVVLTFVGWQFFNLPMSEELLVKKLINLMWTSFELMIKDLKKSFIFLFSLISLVFLINFLGLVPYMFTMTSHLSFNLSMALPLWLGGILVSLMRSVESFLSHLVPTGTPTILLVFLVLVESVSQLIRPFTLSIRLMANVMAGHLIINLMGIFITSSILYSFVLFFQSAFVVFELSMSVVQAYVFVSLLTLYWDES